MPPFPTTSSAGHPILTRGLRTKLPRHALPPIHWCESVTNVIRNHWPPPCPTTTVQKAERGLRITGTPYYFYVMRTELSFGNAVFFFREAHQVEFSGTMQGTTPFDSGGLWDDRITISTNSKISSTKKREIFSCNQTPLSSLEQVFDRYIGSNYRSIKQYIKGLPPTTGTPPIVPGPPNCSRSWTWEARIPVKQVDRHLELVHGFLSRQDRRIYFDWLWNESGLDTHVRTDVAQWATQNITFSPAGVIPSQVAEEQLMRLCQQ